MGSVSLTLENFPGLSEYVQPTDSLVMKFLGLHLLSDV